MSTAGLANTAVRVVTPFRTIVASITVAGLAAWLHAHHPLLVLLPAALLTTLPLLLNARVRIAFIVFGGLFIFQSSSQLNAPKLYFLLGIAVAVVGAISSQRAVSSSVALQAARPLFYASGAFLGLIAISLPVSLVEGTPHKTWLRDSAPYLIFAAAPLFAVDAQRAFSTIALRRLIVVAGFLGTTAFTLRWLTARGIVNVPSAFGLPTLLLAGALFSYAVAEALQGDTKRFRWLLLAAVVIGMLLTTGTRTAAVLLAAPVVITFGARRYLAQRAFRLVAIVPLTAVVIVVGIRGFIGATHGNRQILGTRVSLVFKTGSQSDQSYVSRVAQANAAWRAFKDHALLGQGPGAAIRWQDESGQIVSGASIDTPIAYLAKFGLLGFVPLIVLVASFIAVIRNARLQVEERTIAQLALMGFGGIVIAWSSIQVPFEEKGISSAFLLLLALLLRELPDREPLDVAADERLSHSRSD